MASAADQHNEPAAGDAQAWDRHFAPGGPWERNGGRRQTYVYARAFCSRVALGRGAFTLLDFGCALGEGLRVLHGRYPQATLTGMDISPLAISRAQAELGSIASFAVGEVEAIRDRYDVIYMSHVLEHFVDYQAAARHLLAHCRRLCVVVPFADTIEGRPLRPDPSRQHQHSFFADSFGFLISEGRAASIATHLVCCSGARPRRKAVARHAINVVRGLAGRPTRDVSIIYDVVAKGGSR